MRGLSIDKEGLREWFKGEWFKREFKIYRAQDIESSRERERERACVT